VLNFYHLWLLFSTLNIWVQLDIAGPLPNPITPVSVISRNACRCKRDFSKCLQVVSNEFPEISERFRSYSTWHGRHPRAVGTNPKPWTDRPNQLPSPAAFHKTGLAASRFTTQGSDQVRSSKQSRPFPLGFVAATTTSRRRHRHRCGSSGGGQHRFLQI
jgi:hypothetical protein